MEKAPNSRDSVDNNPGCATDNPGYATDSDGSKRQRRRRREFIRKRLSPRARDVFQGLVRQIGRDRVNIVVETHALRVAELTTAAETLREQLLATTEAPSASLINSITRLESTAARAERALFKLAPPKTAADRWAEAWQQAQQTEDE
jgi:hypothetical protein